jgi:energy-coupling factor transporter ATP-binding protein EcfA2
MRIIQISIRGLFGIFDHIIPLNVGDRITIIHAPNGFGKTAILRLLNGFVNSRYSELRAIPFRQFRLDFEDGSWVEIEKSERDTEKGEETNNIFFVFSDASSIKKSFTPKRIKSRPNLDFPIEIIDGIIPELQRVGSKIWRNLSTGETLSLEVVIDRYEDMLPEKFKLREEPVWLEKLKRNIHVRLIESQRLLNFDPSHTSRAYYKNSPMLPTVSAYSEELARRMREKFTEYGKISQSLDRTFPVRAVKQQASPDFTDEQLRDRLHELEETRSRLIEIGLLDKDENSDFQIQPQSIDESTKHILSIYIEDVEQKLNIFEDIANKIDLLKRIINTKFAYSCKQISFSKEKGFIFQICYPIALDSESKSEAKVLSPTDLSSGEQHELVLLYELLFKVQPDSLVLIDEPELSLHVGWQSQFLKDLQEVTKLADLDVLMATHSPDIIQDRWDLTVELTGLER